MKRFDSSLSINVQLCSKIPMLLLLLRSFARSFVRVSISMINNSDSATSRPPSRSSMGKFKDDDDDDD